MSMVAELKPKIVSAVPSTSGMIFLTSMPSAPDTCVVLLETRPWEPQRTMQQLPAVYWLGLQVLVRWADAAGAYESGKALAVAIAEALQGFSGVLGSSTYLDIAMVAPPAPLGKDENNRDLFSTNFRVCRNNPS